MKPSDSPAGKAWLRNFTTGGSDFEKIGRGGDENLAHLLLDSLTVTSIDKMRETLIPEIKRFISDSIGRVLLMNLEDLDDIAADSAKWSNDFRPLSPKERVKRNPRAFIDFIPGLHISTTPGSEGPVGQILRESVRGVDREKFLTGPFLIDEKAAEEFSQFEIFDDVQFLKSEKIQDILVLTDVISSGGQIVSFVKSLLRNPTIRSWNSGDRVKIHVLAFAATEAGREYVRKSLVKPKSERRRLEHFALRNLHHAHTVETLPFSQDIRDDLIDFCVRYSGLSSQKLEKWRDLRFGPLGYANTGMMFLGTTSSVPNNLPMVLTRRGPDWNPFLLGREMPEEVLGSSVGYFPSENRSLAENFKHIHDLSQYYRARKVENANLAPELILLQKIRLPQAEPAEAALHFGQLTLAGYEEAIADLAKLGLVTDEGHVTPLGLKEARNVRRSRRLNQAEVEYGTDLYYPKSYRSGSSF